MLPDDTFNSYLLVWDNMRHFQALKGIPSSVGCTDRQDHVWTVPSEPPENRVSPSRENMTVWASLSWPISLWICPDLRSSKWITPLPLAWAKTRPDRERGGERKGERKNENQSFISSSNSLQATKYTVLFKL